jgi:hypothetical protein
VKQRLCDHGYGTMFALVSFFLLKMKKIANTNAFDAGVKEKTHENKQNYNC